ncbi:hypothetical protein R9X49_22080 [Pectobacterium carotovorum]|uniref:hypothetical protein n=1 Tax=Pectobacterium carotovorum TaxID=554 RepID=UPI0029DE2E2A|nr:hypothetical protein [Pectobacterium carotovorum]MDX6917788.1 hypothetical protein [Pectobacterium carotovorum]
MTQVRRPSPLQQRILIVLAALEERHSGPVRTLDIADLLEQADDQPVYANNLRESCKRMEVTGWLRTLRAPNLQLAVELTDAGRHVAAPLLATEREAERARQRAADVRVLPVRPENGTRIEHDVTLDGTVYPAWRGDFVVRLDGRTCLQLWHANGRRTVLEGDALQVATWYQACFAAGLPVQCQVNQDRAPC